MPGPDAAQSLPVAAACRHTPFHPHAQEGCERPPLRYTLAVHCVIWQQVVPNNACAAISCAGSFKPQRFTPYGALFGAPLEDDSKVVGRKDFSYTEPTTGPPPPPPPPTVHTSGVLFVQFL